MRGMMNYNCLRVLRSHVRRIGKQSPGFSVFRTREHGYSDAEPCHVPFLAMCIIHFPTILSGAIDKEKGKKERKKKEKKKKEGKLRNKQTTNIIINIMSRQFPKQNWTKTKKETNKNTKN